MRTPCAITALVAIGVAVAGCGASASDRAKPSQRSVPRAAAPALPVASATDHAHAGERLDSSLRTPVATVAGKVITLGALRHWEWLETHERAGAPEPPEYAACVTYLGSALTVVTAQAKERFKRTCEQRYDELSRVALRSLINLQWLIDEAAKDGLKKVRPTSDPSSVPDRLSSEIYGKLERAIPKPTPARVAKYYARHIHSFVVPERRDLYVVRIGTLEAAEKAKRAIEHGTSFATIVAKDTLMQPEEAHGGLLRGLEPHNWPEPPLSKEIFRASVGTLAGPVKITLGYYVFKVLASHPPRQRSLGEARADAANQLHQALRDQTLSRYVTAFRKRWTTRTSCRAGYVVPNCEQFKGSETGVRGEPPDVL